MLFRNEDRLPAMVARNASSNDEGIRPERNASNVLSSSDRLYAASASSNGEDAAAAPPDLPG